ncbi:MAG: ABC transporter permease DevC [Thermoguttaceae bacterium]|jgi:putative ABC transport system permease protein
MRTPLAWHNLVYNKVRTAIAAAGVTFAVVLVFMQLGFLGSIETTVTRFFDALDFDLLIRSPKYLHLSITRTFPRIRLYQAEEVPGVATVTPLEISLTRWRSPVPDPVTGEYKKRGILAIGVRPEQPAFTTPEIREKASLLTDEEFVLIDRKARKEFGPQNGRQFSDADIGVMPEVNGREVRIVGHFALGTGLTADGCILVNTTGFRRLVPPLPGDEVSFGLVRLQNGVDVAAAADRLRRHLDRVLPDGSLGDVEVLTRPQTIRYELNRWISQTSLGIIFQLGVVVSLMVGTVIVYQVLSSDVAAHMRQYATLKAMGYTNQFLSGVVLSQALGLALLGFLPGLVLSLGLYWLTSHLANLPIEMNGPRVVSVLGMTVVMCALSGLGALRKVWLADPAALF